MKYWFLHLLLCLCVGFAMAQPGQIHFTRVDISRGLSQNQVNSIYRDKTGYVWIGTTSGLNRYDGYSFKIFRNSSDDPGSISDNIIASVQPFPNDQLLVITRKGANIYDPGSEQFSQDIKGFFKGIGIQTSAAVSKCLVDERSQYWFLFADGSLYLYKPTDKRSVRIPAELPVSDCFADGRGGFWVIYRNGRIQQWNTGVLQRDFESNGLCFTAAGQPSFYYLFVDSKSNCWVSKNGEATGLYQLSRADGTVRHFSKESGGHKLRSNIIAGITEDLQGNIWIATDHGGINMLNAKSGTMQYLENNADDPRSISQNSLTSMYRDNQGIIWVGTYKQGFNYFNQTIPRFPLYKHLSNTPSLPYDDVNRFVEDAKGNLWIGTNGGGLIYFDRAANSFKQWLAGPSSISNNVIVSLWIDHQQKLWIGSYYGGLDCFDGKKFTYYKNDPADDGSLSDNRVWEIFEDSRQDLWVGTLNGGLNKLDRANDRFVHFRADTANPNALQSNYISAIVEDRKGQLWIGSSDGIDIMDAVNQQFKHLGKTTEAGSLSNDVVLCMLQDSRGLMWIGTREGLNVYNKTTDKFRLFGRQEGLADNTILNILEDNDGRLWISTPGGISQMIVSGANDITTLKASFHNYDELNNLQAREFNENAALKTRRGELIFGGPYGFNIFQPRQITGSSKKPPVVLTGFDLFNKELHVGENINGKVLLPQAISQTRELVLPYNQDVFSITFAALDFSHTEKDRYAYAMEGFNDNWLMTDGNQRKATFTNLDPGNYVFKVRSVNNSGELSDNETRLAITILPPFWKTPLAFVLYALAIIAALWLARRIILQRAHMRFAMEQVRKEAQRMHELDLMKIRFITNVSHEFRTPLSLILSPADKLLKQAHEPEQRKQFQIIHRNARRLLNLVNQLLDFRKLEVEEFSFLPTEADIVAFVKEISYSFTDIAEKKNIGFRFSTGIASRTMFFDADKMEKILFNLLSNAYKFTPEGGQVSVEISEEESQLGSLEQKSQIRVKVCDTGIGIPKDKQQKIFERFFQHEMPGNILNQGSGIGLAIVNEFVKLHDGNIQVDSEPGKGSCFTLLLPVRETAGIALASDAGVNDGAINLADKDAPIAESAFPRLKGKRNTILIVEDNEDFRFYLKDNLGLHFHIVEAGNGKDGWQKALEQQPDLVVSDVMMPVMNGLELAQKLKHDPRTASIPVILLTARSAEEQQLEGLDTGANDYITKPFSFEILLSRIKNLLQQQKLNKKPAKQITVSTADVQIENVDEKAIQLALQIVEKNMSNAEFSVEDMSREMMMSRVGLYKKMVALTGKTPIEFIRDIRLARSLQLLEKSELTVAEIAYEVGYNDPKYFAKTFKKAFGVLPSGYNSRMITEEDES